MDLWTYSVPSRIWLAGRNPYDRATLRAEVLGRFGSRRPDLSDSDQIASGLLPCALVLLVPLALVPDELAARLIWLASFASLLFACWAMLELWGRNWRAEEGLWLVALLLQSRLIQSVAYRGQPTLILLAAMLLGLLAERRGSSWLAGAALVVLLAKFTVALPLAAFWLSQRRWAPLLRAAGLAAALSLPPLVTIGPAALVHGWVDSVRTLEYWNRTSGGGFHLTHWSSILDRLLPAGSSLLVVASSALLVSAVVLPGWAWRLAPERASPWRFLALTALGMVAVYHRVYDAVLLLPAAVLVWGELRDPEQRTGTSFVLAGALSVLLFVLAPQTVAKSLSEWLETHSPAGMLAPVNAWICIAVFLLAVSLERGHAAAARTRVVAAGASRQG